MKRPTQSGLDRRRAGLVIVAACLAAGCGPGPDARMTPPARSRALRLGDPAPATIRATRMFTVEPAGAALDWMCRRAAARVPLVYTCGACQRAAEPALLARVETFRRWVRGMQKVTMSRKPSAMARLRHGYGTVMGQPLAPEVLRRLHAAPGDDITAAFTAMSRGAVGPYRVEARGPLEQDFEGDEVILRLLGPKGKWSSVKIHASQVQDFSDIREALSTLAVQVGGKLHRSVQRDLTAIASAGLSPSITLDLKRTRTGIAAAIAAEKARRLSFEQGQAVIEKGEVYTPVHRQILRELNAVDCVPCKGGLVRCADGPLRRLQVGGGVFHPIRATRDFRIPMNDALMRVLARQAEDAIPRVFVTDPAAALSRAEALGKLFDLARSKTPKKRWAVLQEGLADRFKVKVIIQLLMGFGGAPPDKVRDAVLDLYHRVQEEAIMAGRPPATNESCTLRRAARVEKKKGGAKPRRKPGKGEVDSDPVEATHEACPVVPLPRLRLELPRRAARYSGLLSGLPKAARKSTVELVQELILANTTFDLEETSRRRAVARKGIKGNAHLFRKGGVVILPRKQVTKEDLFILEQMFSVSCAPKVPAHGAK